MNAPTGRAGLADPTQPTAFITTTGSHGDHDHDDDEPVLRIHRVSFVWDEQHMFDGLPKTDLEEYAEILDRQQEAIEAAFRRANPTFRKQNTICKHWLRGLCKFRDYDCPHQHVYDDRLRPVCHFFIRNQCTNPDCPFLHPNQTESVLCVSYARGFCKLGDKCPWQHKRKTEHDLLNYRHCVEEAEMSQRSYESRNRQVLQSIASSSSTTTSKHDLHVSRGDRDRGSSRPAM